MLTRTLRNGPRQGDTVVAYTHGWLNIPPGDLMDEFLELLTRLGTAFQGGGEEADRLLLLQAAGHTLALLAALLIPLGILYYVARRRGFEFPGLIWLFALAGFAVALSHGLALWGLWQPDDWLQASTQMAAAALAFGTALMLWMLLPDALRMPSLRQLRRANANLTRESWEQQRALKEAQDEATLFRELVAKTELGTALVSPAGRWLQVNQRMVEALSLPRTQLLKEDPRQVFGNPFLDGDDSEEERESTLTGEARWYRWTTTTVERANGWGHARLIQCRDISAEKRTQMELQRLREALEASTAQRARDATEMSARLEQALAERQTSEGDLSQHAIRLARSAAQLELLGARLSELTGHDPASGLLSSNALAERLNVAVAAARRYAHTFSVLVIALDRLDDADPPDTVFKALGSVLRAELRETDAAARCDKNSVCVLLPEADLAAARLIAKRVRRRLATTPFAMDDGRTLRLSCQIGAAQWKTGQRLGEVLGQAADDLRKNPAGPRDKTAVRSEEKGPR